jgi:uncharacterized protein
MTRILFWLALAFLVVAAIRAKLKGESRHPKPQPPVRRSAPKEAGETEPMLQCAHCGVHYPASENVPAGGRNYCSAAHAPAA